MATKFNKPSWTESVIDPKGWRCPKTGELLVSRRFTLEQIEEWNGLVMEEDEGGNIDTEVDTKADTEVADKKLEDFTREELAEMAKKLGIKVYKSYRKPRLIEEIEAYQAEDK